MMIMRKVAQAASAGFVKKEDFESFWPSPYKTEAKIDFTSEEYKKWYRDMKLKNNIK